MSRRPTRQRTAHDPGSSAVEFSLMVAAMAAMILAVVLGIGRVVGNTLFHGCTEISAQVAADGECIAPEQPAAGDGAKTGHAPAGSAGQSPDDSRQAPGTNDLGGSSDDM